MSTYRTSADQQDPHACGIDESAGSPSSQDRVTPPGISDDPTDDVLRTPGVLPMGEVTQGMTPDSLADVTRAALTTGFEVVNVPDSSLDDAGNGKGDAVDPRGYPVNAFGRPEATRPGARTGGF